MHYRNHREQAFENRVRTWILHHIKIIVWIACGFGLFTFGGIVFWISSLKIPTLDSFQTRTVANSTKIYDRTGKILLYDVNKGIKRTEVPTEKISEHIKQAVVAIEDKYFYEHRGIRVRSIIRAVLQNLSDQGLSQGGSTITQQVVKNTLLTQERRISRKLKEWILSLKLERVYSKDAILTTYLNEAPFGGSIYGVEEASQRFFNKTALDINVAESAYLAAILNAPTFYSPYGQNRAKLDARKNQVLKNMHDLEFIDDVTYEAARVEEVVFRPQAESNAKALHFVEFVRSYLENKYGRDMVERTGLKVTTTLDWDLQSKAEYIVFQGAINNQEQWNASNQGLIALDPKSGGILTMVGSRDYNDVEVDGNYNVTLARRQPGSAFKPIVYVRAFEKGFRPETILFDLRTQFTQECSPGDFSNERPCYAPAEYDDLYPGPITLRNALGQSRNIPAVKLLYLVGVDDILRTAKNLGITTLDRNANRYGLTLVLGGGEVSLLELSSAYGTFANDGVWTPPYAIEKVETLDGTILEQHAPSNVRVLQPQAVRQLNSVLSDNVARTPLFGSRSFLYFENRDVAGKTGTTNDNRDAWLVGYTPNIVVGVWSGNNDNTPMKKGSVISGPTWRTFMDVALRNLPNESFPEPAPLPNTGKPVLRGLWYGNESFAVDTVSGKLATDLTPEETRKEYVIPNPRSILYWMNPGDPTGPVPNNPENNPSYVRWQRAIDDWLRLNPGAVPPAPVAPTEKDDVHTEANRPVVTFNALQPVVAVNTPVTVRVSISSKYPITSVDYYANAAFLGTATDAPFSITFTPEEYGIGKGAMTIRAVATDNIYNRGEKEIEIRGE